MGQSAGGNERHHRSQVKEMPSGFTLTKTVNIATRRLVSLRAVRGPEKVVLLPLTARARQNLVDLLPPGSEMLPPADAAFVAYGLDPNRHPDGFFYGTYERCLIEFETALYRPRVGAVSAPAPCVAER